MSPQTLNNTSIEANVAARILQRCAAQPEQDLFLEDAGSVTCARFSTEAASRARQLREAGIDQGDLVLVVTGRGYRFWRDCTAVWAIGAVTVPYEHDIDTDRGTVVRGKVPARAALCDTPPAGIDQDHYILLPEPPTANGAPPLEPVAVACDDLAIVMFTSGSTGDPKGVALPHRSVIGNALATGEELRLTPDDTLFFAIPFQFVSALSHFVVAAHGGATMAATEQRLFAGDLFERVRQSGASCFGGSPLQLRWISECAADEHLALRWVMSSGDHLPISVIRALRQHLPDTRVWTVYGLTELAGRFCMLNPDLVDAHAGTVGRPIQGLGVSVCDEHGKPLPPGTVGEVYAKGDYLMHGYFGEPEVTAGVLGEQGFRTGDTGHLDEAGLLQLQGRSDDVFKSGGQKVSAVAVTEALMRTGAFADVAVVGREHPLMGKVASAIYVLRAGEQFDRRQVQAALRESLEPFEMPRRFTEVAEIPRTGSGKVRRAAVHALLDASS